MPLVFLSLVVPLVSLAQEAEQPPEKFLFPGRIEGTGNYFEIKNSQYLNTSLKSSEEIKVILESIPKMINIIVETALNENEISSTILTIAGLEPNKTYYEYRDSYKNGVEIVADENGSYSWVQDLTQPHHIWFQETKSTVFLPADCQTYGTWDATTSTCALSQDIIQSVEIALVETQTDNITLDCQGHQISGSGAYGIFLNGFWKRNTGGLKNVTVKNCNVSNFSYGIYTDFTNQSTLENNTSQNNYVGIQLQNSPNNLILGNITQNNRAGIYISYSDSNTFNNNQIKSNQYAVIIANYSGNNVLRNNIILDNQNSIYLCLDSCSPPVNPVQDIDASNTIDGKPIYYLVNQANQEILADAGFVGLVNSSNIAVKNLTLDVPNFYAIFLVGTKDSTIENNYISNSQFGIYLSSSTGNTFLQNTVKDNRGEALYLYNSSGNVFYHNNFINNLGFCSQVFNWPVASANLFDNGYPSGGNFWSDYTGADLKSGPNQNQESSDGIGDTPQFIKYYSFGTCQKSSQKDNYPFMKENSWVEVELPLPTKAAELAKLVIDGPYLGDGDTFGGKGWDPFQAQYVTPSKIFGGYNYWNNKLRKIAFGAGLDCSGLTQWAFNRSFDPTKSLLRNVIRYDGADGQYKNNSESITESNLQPGDLLFLDKYSDNRIDHVAMYVGDNGTFDIVEAFSPAEGIISSNIVEFKTRIGFDQNKHIRRVAISPSLGGQVKAGSPIDLIVTDPDGFTITPTTAIQTDEEYLREVPGELYYTENVLGVDGRPEDIVYWPVQKTGNYIIKVIPEVGVPLTETYNLEFQTGSQIIVLAENTPLNQIPSEGYGVGVTETGVITSFIPVAIDIKPGSYPNSINLNSKGTVPVAIFGNSTFDVHKINLTSITLAGAPIKIKNNGQLMANYEDVNKDGFVDVVIHIITKSLQLMLNDVKAELNGFLFGGKEIKGSDSVKIVP